MSVRQPVGARQEGPEPWTMLASRVLAPNPSPFSLEGTNSYLLRDPASYRVVVVDPGPAAALHLHELVAHGQVELILLTHAHNDHVESAPQLARMTGAPVRAADTALCIGAPALHDGEELHVGGTRIQVVATPGHTADSVCFRLPDDRLADVHPGAGSMLTGDTILGRGYSVVAPPDGSLRAYFDSLDRLQDAGDLTVLPGHGPLRGSLRMVAAEYAQHRRARLARVERVARELDASDAGPATVEKVADIVYAHVPADLRAGAEMAVAAQLTYLLEAPAGRA